MKIEAQNIALAELSGSSFNKPTEQEIALGSYYQYEPDFTKNLNLILAVVREKIEGDSDLESAFLDHLYDIIDSRQPANDEADCIVNVDITLLTCSAAEYCEAALVALGKWVENE